MIEALKRLWSGDLPLDQAFWTWAVLGGLLVNIATSGLFLALMAQDLPILALIGGYGLSVPYNVVAMVGVWRAADRHQGDRQWAETARVVTLVGLLLLTVT
ncbi:MAG: hypothetical protein R3316_10215 [Rhodovibrionaceae bacterium]|nr:hypothetical protein [Rhodovibrionaceae bacterium]